MQYRQYREEGGGVAAQVWPVAVCPAGAVNTVAYNIPGRAHRSYHRMRGCTLFVHVYSVQNQPESTCMCVASCNQQAHRSELVSM